MCVCVWGGGGVAVGEGDICASALLFRLDFLVICGDLGES